MASQSEMCFVCVLVNYLASNNPTGFPDPFAVLTVDGEQTKTTSVIKKTLNPYWNESFDVYDSLILK
jgi:E3 ubiquitin-protein ligase NEDD4